MGCAARSAGPPPLASMVGLLFSGNQSQITPKAPPSPLRSSGQIVPSICTLRSRYSIAGITHASQQERVGIRSQILGGWAAALNIDLLGGSVTLLPDHGGGNPRASGPRD